MRGRNVLITTARLSQERLRQTPIVVVKERANTNDIRLWQESICTEYNKLVATYNPPRAQLNSSHYTKRSSMDKIVGVSTTYCWGHDSVYCT